MIFRRKRLLAVTVAVVATLMSFSAMGSPAGSAGQARAALPGDLDRRFGDDGVVTAALGRGDRERARDVAGQPDGRFVVAGRSGSTGLVARFNPNGSLDRRFGVGGSTGTPGLPWSQVVIDANGRVITAGAAGGEVTVARFLPDGSTDQGFGKSGIVRFDPEPGDASGLPDLAVTGLAAVGDRVMVAGIPEICRYDDDSEQFFPCQQPFVLRLTEEGTPDEGYGDDGVLRTATGPVRRTVGLVPDGRAIVLGTEEHWRYDEDSSSVTYARFFDPEGRPDASIGRSGDGLVTLPATTGDTSVPPTASVDGAGRILLATGNLYRFRPNGRVDFWTRIYSPEGEVTASDLSIDHRDRPMLAGHTRRRGTVRPWAVRLKDDGQPDPAFSNDGLASGRMPGRRAASEGSPLRPVGIVRGRNGTWLLVGTAKRGDRLRFMISAYHGGERRVPDCLGQEVTWLGTNGPDRVTLDGGVVAGLGGDDRVEIKSGAVCGGPGDDRISGSAKQVDGGSGDDIIRYTGRTYPVITTKISNWLSGGPGDDTIVGSGVNDSIRGGTGEDTLRGLGGRDRIHGGPGRDSIMGGSGYDRLTGGPGRDRIEPGTGEAPRTYYRGKRRGVWIELRRSGNRLKEVRVQAWEKCDGSPRSRSEFQVTNPVKIDPRTGKFRLRPKRAWFDDQLIGRVKGRTVVGTFEYYSPGEDWFPTCHIVGGPALGVVKFKARLVPRPRDVILP